MSRSALKDDITIIAIGMSDHAANSASPIALPMRARMLALGIGRKHLLVEAAQIPDREHQRGQHQEPSGGGSDAERVVTKCLEVEVDGEHFRRAGWSTLRQQPDFREQSERENVSEQHGD